MNNFIDKIVNQLQPLIGLQLTIARRGADMRGFHFGPIQSIEGGTIGDYALHIQCPWRIEGPHGIVTGRSDLYKPDVANPDIDWDTWDYASGNYQDKQIGALLGGYDPDTHSFVNQTDYLFVESIQADEYGGAIIGLSGGFRLVLFPAGSAEMEDWRIFGPTQDGTGGAPHFIISGGKIEYDGPDSA